MVPYTIFQRESAYNKTDYFRAGAVLTRYLARLYSIAIRAIYFIMFTGAADPTCDCAWQNLSSCNSIAFIPPADHYLSDYFRSGHDLRT